MGERSITGKQKQQIFGSGHLFSLNDQITAVFQAFCVYERRNKDRVNDVTRSFLDI